MPEPNVPFTMHGTDVPAGKTRRIEIPVSTLSTGTQLSLPVAIVNGRYSGPRLLLSAAIHGDELNGVEIVRQILNDIDPRSLRGTIIATPVVNVFGYLMQTRNLPDRRDLNRSFPGSKSGSLASRLAHLFLETIVSKADFGVDFHTGSGGRTNIAQIRGNLHDEQTFAAALQFGAPVVVQARERANSLRAIASSRGLPMLVFEGGEALRFDRDAIKIGVQGVWRLMGHLGMRPGTNEPLKKPPFVAGSSTWLRTSRGGVFHEATRPGDKVKEGENLGVVMDIYGRTRARVVAPWPGMVIGMVCNPLVSRGDAVLHLASAKPFTL
jgi:predicted deacylase